MIVVWLFLLVSWALSAVCDCDILRSYSLFLSVIHANSDGFGESANLLGIV